jgi:predicted transposase/invertase (TIGR01784 family)
MRFINPKTDFAFKKIFGSDRSKPILISFLNALLYQGQPVIVDLEIIDPYLAPKIQGMKDTFVDVRARLQDGRTVIIEMQVLNVEGFEKRVLYNAAKAYSTQLLVGESYQGLHAVVALTITDFVMFPECAELQSAFVLKEKTRLTDYPEGDLELVFVGLPKFTKSLEELETVKDKWLYFLRNASKLQMIPETMEAAPEIRAAFQIANAAKLTAEEIDIQERKLMFIFDHRGAIIKAEKQGREQGVRLAREERWRMEVEKGRAEMAQTIARRLLAQLSNEQIAEITGLPPESVAALRNEQA